MVLPDWLYLITVLPGPDMEALQIYHHLNPEKKDTSFQLKRMEAVYDQHKGAPAEPHRHNYYNVLLVNEGQATHHLDFHEYAVQDQQVLFVSPGQVHQLVEHERSSGYIISFTRDFLIQNGINECFISDINLFRDYEESPPLNLDDNILARLQSYVQLMESYLDKDYQFKFEAISAYLKLFLIVCNEACEPLFDDDNPQSLHTTTHLLRQFKILVEEVFTYEHQVNYYAERLSITADYLNKVVKNSIGISAKDFILQRILLEAKRQLIYSNAPSKEIGYELGFRDPAYFSNFIKKHTGKSVRSFREEFGKYTS